MKHLALYLGMAAAMVVSCSVQEKDFQTLNRDDVVFYASFEQPGDADTKVYVNEELRLRWNADDRVSIFNQNTYNQQFAFTGETGDNAGEFKKVNTGGFVTGNDIADVVSVYPYQASTKISEDEEITVTLPAEQAYAKNTFGLGANTMVSVSSDNLLQFKNVGGYLMVKLYGEGVSVKTIKLTGNNGEKLAGKASVTMPLDDVPTVTMADDATTEIVLSCDHPVQLGSSEDQSTEFWFVVPPTTFTGGFTIRVVDSEGNIYERSTSKSVSVERNTLSKMGAFDLNSYLIYKYQAPIVIDGTFDDWAGLDASRVATAECDPDSNYLALKLVKVYADVHSIFVYFEWDTDMIFYESGVEHVPFHCYVNTDGDSSTGGYDLFTDASFDALVEGYIYPDGVLGSYDPDIWSWAGEQNGSGWDWGDPCYTAGGIGQGAGVEGKYEFSLDRAKIADVGFSIADEFSIGFDICQYWNLVGVLPNAAITDEHPSGKTQSLPVTALDPFVIPVS